MGGSNDMEEAKVNIVLDTITDLRTSAITVKFEKDEAKKAEGQKKLMEETLPKTLQFFEKMIKDNGCKEGYIVGKGLTAADLIIFEGLEFCLGTGDMPVLDKYTGVKALKKKVETNAKVAAYLKARPVTEF